MPSCRMERSSLGLLLVTFMQMLAHFLTALAAVEHRADPVEYFVGSAEAVADFEPASFFVIVQQRRGLAAERLQAFGEQLRLVVASLALQQAAHHLFVVDRQADDDVERATRGRKRLVERLGLIERAGKAIE